MADQIESPPPSPDREVRSIFFPESGDTDLLPINPLVTVSEGPQMPGRRVEAVHGRIRGSVLSSDIGHSSGLPDPEALPFRDSVVTGTLTSSFRKKEGLGKKSGSRVNFNLPPELPPDPPPGLERSSILSVSSGGGFKRTPTGGLGLGARSSSFGGVESSTSLKSLKGRRDAFFGDMLLDPPPGKGGKPMRAVDSVQVGPSEKRR